MVKTGFDPPFTGTLISSGHLAQVRALFDQMAPHRRNAFSLNRMLSGYSRSGQIGAAHSPSSSPPRSASAMHSPGPS
jgi:hypothetical protein